MPHSSQKDVNKPMDAWDRQRCGIALLELKEQVALLGSLVKQSAEPFSHTHSAVDKGMESVRRAIAKFIDETE